MDGTTGKKSVFFSIEQNSRKAINYMEKKRYLV